MWRRLAPCAALALACATPDAHELRLEGEDALRACAERRVDTSMCLSLEVIQAEYEQCLRRQPGEARCEEIWRSVAELSAPTPLPPPPLPRRGFHSLP